jgi:hypothetical protein
MIIIKINYFVVWGKCRVLKSVTVIGYYIYHWAVRIEIRS